FTRSATTVISALALHDALPICHLPALGLLALALAACPAARAAAATPAPAAASTQDASHRLNAWFDARYEQYLQLSPMRLTFLGRKELNDRLDDLSEAGMRQRVEWLGASVREMEATFARAQLDPEAQRAWDLWKRQYEQARDSLAWTAHEYPFNQMGGAHATLPTFLINFHKVDDERDYLAYVARLANVPVMFDQLLARAEGSAAAGIRPPRF